jgi:hypothetical protein
VAKQFDGDQTNGLTTTFGAVGGIFYQKLFINGLQPLARQPPEQVARHLDITTYYQIVSELRNSDTRCVNPVK